MSGRTEDTKTFTTGDGGPENPVAASRGGLEMPSLGLGTWTMGEDPARRAREVALATLAGETAVEVVVFDRSQAPVGRAGF